MGTLRKSDGFITPEDAVTGNGVNDIIDTTPGNDSDTRDEPQKFIDPTEAIGGDRSAESKPKRKPGRPPKQQPTAQGGEPERKTKPNNSAVIDVDGISYILLSLHEMAATALKSHEIKLETKEAKLLSERACKVAAHYNFAPSEKIQDWCALVMVAGQIYYPRFLLIKMRLEAEALARKQESLGLQVAGATI